MDAPPLLEVSGATLGYGRDVVLEAVDLAVRPGDYLGLVGPNGSGKTTLLRAMLGALPPLAGAVTRDPSLELIGYVPQRHALDACFPLGVLEVVLMGRYGGLAAGRRPAEEDRSRARLALAQVGLGRLEESLFRDLSGGQQQRVLIARALASASALLFLDEPTTGMDLPSEAEIMGLLDGLHRDEGITIVLVTHQLELVAEHASRLAILREGTLHVGTREEMLTPETLSRTYGVPVEVLEVAGSRVIRAHQGPEERGEEP